MEKMLYNEHIFTTATFPHTDLENKEKFATREKKKKKK